MSEDTQTIFISSSGSTYKSIDGSTLGINLEKPINVYKKRLRVLNSTYWNNFQNVNPTYNNVKMEFIYNAVTHTITFPNGLYSVDDLNETIMDYLINNGLPSNLLYIQADESTNTLSLIIMTTIAFSMNFDAANNTLFKNTLGFSGNVNTAVNKVVNSTGPITLNVYENVLFHVSFCGGSTIFNEKHGSTVVAISPLVAKTGSLVYYEPINPMKCYCVGGEISSFQVWITDQNGTRLSTNGEDFSIALELY